MSVHKFKFYDGKDPRDIPAYSFQEASKYTGVPLNTLRDWVSGRKYPHGKIVGPLVIRPDDDQTELSFTNLIETHVLNAIRRYHKVPMARVRNALDFLRRHFDSSNPLAEHDFETDGIDLFISQVNETDHLVNISQHGQLAMKEILKAHLKRVERDEQGLARQLFPFTRTISDNIANDPKMVSINPLVAFGRSVISGTGIPTAIIAERYKTGESIIEIAEDYNRKVSEIEEAIRCEFELKAA